jgi:hypothetical protein
LESKKTATNADKEFIKMAHNASQAYIELENQAFRGDSVLSGETTEKFQTLEDVGFYVDNIKVVILVDNNKLQ